MLCSPTLTGGAFLVPKTPFSALIVKDTTMSRANFAISLKLMADNFHKGADQVKKSLNRMKYTAMGMFAVFGAGSLSLSNMARQLTQVARETNRARMLLETVSRSASDFAGNINYLREMSSRYGQELNQMTNDFSRFSLAAGTAGVSLDEQRQIFTSFTRAIAAFNIDSGGASAIFQTISQMMSRGQVNMRELHNQLGRDMPIAMEAMARAAGVSINELEDFVRRGEMLSADIMGRFAKEIENMLPEINTDNIEASINRLRNTFNDLADSLGIADIFKSVVDMKSRMIASIQRNWSILVAFVITLLSGKLWGAIVGFYRNVTKLRTATLSAHRKAEASKARATEQRVAAQKRLEEARANHAVATGKSIAAAKRQLEKAEMAANSAVRAERMAQDKLEVARQKANLVRGKTAWHGFFMQIKVGAKQAGLALKKMAAAFAPMAILSALTFLVTRFIQARKEAERIRNIFSDFQKEMQNVNGGEEATRLRTLLGIVNERKGTEEEINAAKRELMRLLGVQKADEKQLNALVAERIRLLEATARVDLAARNKAQAEQRIREIERVHGEGIRYIDPERRTAIRTMQGGNTGAVTVGGHRVYDRDTRNAHTEVQQQLRIIADADEVIRTSVVDILPGNNRPHSTTFASIHEPETTPLQRAEQRYAEQLLRLTNQKEAQAITTEEYNKAIDALNRATHQEIAGILGRYAEHNATFQQARLGVENPLHLEDTDLVRAQQDYYDRLRALRNQLDNKAITEEQYQQELIRLINSTMNAIGALDDIGDAGREYIAALREQRNQLIETPERGQRDTTFDYKRSEREKLSEEVRLAEDFVRQWERLVELYGEGAEALAEAENNAQSLRDALIFAEVREDIEEMERALREMSWDAITGVMGSIDRIQSSFSRMVDTLNSVDATAWERLFAVFQAIASTIDGISSVVRTMENLTDITQRLAAARQAAALLDNAKTAQEISNITAVTAAKVSANATQKASDTAKAAVSVAAANAETTANVAGAGAKVISAHAGIPFVGIGIAAAMIAGIVALMRGLPRFESGGIVGGTSFSGDKVLARLNSGEMVLNKGQQTRLFDILDGKRLHGQSNGGGGGTVEFKISGKELVGILQQEDIRKSRR